MSQKEAKVIELDGDEENGGSATEMKCLPKSKKLGASVIRPKRKLVKNMMFEQIVRFSASLFHGGGGGAAALPPPKTEISRFGTIRSEAAEKMKIHPFRDDPGAIFPQGFNI
ncbi:hypothetical protein Nepgr_002755 [Nepenthes gracilis]|uniref:Uncharacterized protein n=1 Tax=Nepenthes gracilis TaxID=150966 RepID=A0AAD3P7F3_NEPGR|nr:hypothetical protein Nepgr_002755 [Nepenthes gracilis]